MANPVEPEALEHPSPDAVSGAFATQGTTSRLAQWLGRFAKRKPEGAISAAVIIVVVLAALFAPWVAPYGSSERDAAAIMVGPSLDHPFGTDQLGRDTLSRVIYGARLSLYIGLAATLISTFIGLIIGVVAGYFGGKLDAAVGVVIDAVMAFPALILAIALVTALGASAENVVLAVLMPFSARVARVVRANVLTVRNQLYVEASRAVGCSSARTIFRYIVPNVMATVIIMASLYLPAALLVEGALSFLGLGPPPPTPSWGRMLSDEGQQFYRTAPWLAIWPGLALAFVVYAFNLFGDSLRDFLDPRLRER